MIHDRKKYGLKKNYNKKYNQQITMDFWMTKFRPYLQKPLSWSIFVGLIFPPPNTYVKELSRWVAFSIEFIS
jgi:hypothetical protein